MNTLEQGILILIGLVLSAVLFALSAFFTRATPQRIIAALVSSVALIPFVITWDSVAWARPEAQPTVDTALLAEGQKRQVIQFNPNAALQKQVFADGFVPNSSEFGMQISGVSYTA